MTSRKVVLPLAFGPTRAQNRPSVWSTDLRQRNERVWMRVNMVQSPTMTTIMRPSKPASNILPLGLRSAVAVNHAQLHQASRQPGFDSPNRDFKYLRDFTVGTIFQ